MQALPLPRSILLASVALALAANAGCGPDESEASSGASAADTSPGPAQEQAFKLSVAQNDLAVEVDGFRIVPPMGLGSWAAFAPTGAGSEMVVMGDVVVQESEILPVLQTVVEQGLTATALHNHFVRASPAVMYMHIGGRGERSTLRRAVETVFGRVADLRGGDPAEAPADDVENTLDTAAISRALGHGGVMDRGVYKVTIGRRDVDLTAHGVAVTTEMGFNTWAAWQGSPDRAAVSGDFAMLADEVAPVIEALVDHGIEVVAVHNHMVHEQPRIFFLHYWGVGPAEKLAEGLRAALDRTGTPPGDETRP